MKTTATALSTIILLVLGLLYASMHMQDSGERLSTQIVPMPMIGMTMAKGPWPKCVGMSGEDCAEYIQSNAENVYAEIHYHDDIVSRDFDTERVRIYVDDNDIVDEIPSRG